MQCNKPIKDIKSVVQGSCSSKQHYIISSFISQCRPSDTADGDTSVRLRFTNIDQNQHDKNLNIEYR